MSLTPLLVSPPGLLADLGLGLMCLSLPLGDLDSSTLAVKSSRLVVAQADDTTEYMGLCATLEVIESLARSARILQCPTSRGLDDSLGY